MSAPEGAERRLLDEQIDYYRARAPEYDEWFFRQGRFDRGPEHRRHWQAEVAWVEAALAATEPRGLILELAGGTGLWTRHLAARLLEHGDQAARLTVVDASPEMLEINRRRLEAERPEALLHTEYVQADLFDWQPSRRHDFLFFGFWLSHVPHERFAPFWHKVSEAVTEGGRIFFVDSLFEPESTARDHAPLDHTGRVRRKLNDGREVEIYKVFYDPARLTADLRDLGFTGKVRTSGRFFLYGCVSRSCL